MGKILEKILTNRLAYMAPNILDLNQFRGIKKRSAIDIVLALIYDI